MSRNGLRNAALIATPFWALVLIAVALLGLPTVLVGVGAFTLITVLLAETAVRVRDASARHNTQNPADRADALLAEHLDGAR